MENTVMKRIATILTATILVVLLGGCATVLKGNTQDISFASDPGAAQIYLNGIYFGTTPFTIELDSTTSYTVEFRKEGYRSKTVVLNSEVGAGWVILDVVTGFVPVVVDAVTGSWKSLDDNMVIQTLERE
jgi:FlaG/FlaF family flagellin (archaellin)